MLQVISAIRLFHCVLERFPVSVLSVVDTQRLQARPKIHVPLLPTPWTIRDWRSSHVVLEFHGISGGFREGAIPLFVYITDNMLRDPDADFDTPGGCPMDAGKADVVDALDEIGGYLIGINAASGGSYTDQMNDLAEATDSLADLDGDGEADEPLVYNWSGSDSGFRDTIISAIEDLMNSKRFSSVELQIVGDEYGFITDIDPEEYEDVELVSGIEVLEFTIEIEGVVEATSEDQLFAITLNMVGDGHILIDTLTLVVVVHGASD